MTARVLTQTEGGESVPREIWQYMANIRSFKPTDWLRYLSWMSTIFGLLLTTVSFTVFGYVNGVDWPGYVWWVPIGNFLFAASLAVDDIGHRTIYKSQLRRGEAYVHQMIVATAVPSIVFLCLCYQHPQVFSMVALGFTILSFFYSALDEAMHWHRYLTQRLDRVEMWAHFVAIVGHVVMVSAWWQWFNAGYPGVTETIGKIMALATQST